jgi:hypothetical protein
MSKLNVLLFGALMFISGMLICKGIAVEVYAVIAGTILVTMMTVAIIGAVISNRNDNIQLMKIVKEHDDFILEFTKRSNETRLEFDMPLLDIDGKIPMPDGTVLPSWSRRAANSKRRSIQLNEVQTAA